MFYDAENHLLLKRYAIARSSVIVNTAPRSGVLGMGALSSDFALSVLMDCHKVTWSD